MSETSSILRKLRDIKPNLVNKYKVSKIGLFGSYSRNEQKPESDVDILVEFSEPIGLDFSLLADDLEKLLHEKVDLVSSKGIKPSYMKFIKKDLQYV